MLRYKELALLLAVFSICACRPELGGSPRELLGVHLPKTAAYGSSSFGYRSAQAQW